MLVSNCLKITFYLMLFFNLHTLIINSVVWKHLEDLSVILGQSRFNVENTWEAIHGMLDSFRLFLRLDFLCPCTY